MEKNWWKVKVCSHPLRREKEKHQLRHHRPSSQRENQRVQTSDTGISRLTAILSMNVCNQTLDILIKSLVDPSFYFGSTLPRCRSWSSDVERSHLRRNWRIDFSVSLGSGHRFVKLRSHYSWRLSLYYFFAIRSKIKQSKVNVRRA